MKEKMLFKVQSSAEELANCLEVAKGKPEAREVNEILQNLLTSWYGYLDLVGKEELE